MASPVQKRPRAAAGAQEGAKVVFNKRIRLSLKGLRKPAQAAQATQQREVFVLPVVQGPSLGLQPFWADSAAPSKAQPRSAEPTCSLDSWARQQRSLSLAPGGACCPSEASEDTQDSASSGCSGSSAATAACAEGACPSSPSAATSPAPSPPAAIVASSGEHAPPAGPCAPASGAAGLSPAFSFGERPFLLPDDITLLAFDIVCGLEAQAAADAAAAAAAAAAATS